MIRYLSTSDVAALLACSPKTIQAAIQNGRVIPDVVIGSGPRQTYGFTRASALKIKIDTGKRHKST